MTTYQVTSNRNEHELIASWPDLPERANHPVAVFKELKLATVAKSVLNAASRYRWHRWVQLQDQGVFTDERVRPDPIERPATAQLPPGSARTSGQPPWLPRLPTSVVLGDAPISDYLQTRIEALIPGPDQEPAPVETDSAGFTERVSIGNLRPLLWRDWCSHLQTAEHDGLAAELDSELAAMTGPLTGRARQTAWYLSAELLIDEDRSRLVPFDKGDDGEKRAKAFQKSLVQLLSDLGRPSRRVNGGRLGPRQRGAAAGVLAQDGRRVLARPGMLVPRVAGLGLGRRSVHCLASRGHNADRHEHR